MKVHPMKRSLNRAAVALEYKCYFFVNDQSLISVQIFFWILLTRIHYNG